MDLLVHRTIVVTPICTAMMDGPRIRASHVQTVVNLAVLTILSMICAALALDLALDLALALQLPTIFLGQLLCYLYFILVILSQSMMGVDGHQQI